MEEPQIVDEPTITRKEPKKTKKAGKKASRIGGVAISYLIVVIAFVIGVIICSLDNGAIDLQITMVFYKELGGSNASPGPWYDFGQFFNPSPLFAFDTGDYENAWGNLYIGMIFGEIFLIIGVIILIMALIAYGNEKGKAKKENRPIVIPERAKYYKYCWVLIIAGGIVALGLTQLFKDMTGRWRPNDLADLSRIFTPWYIIAGNDSDSFWSGHTSQSTLTTALALFLLGSRKKKLAGVVAILTAVYTVCTGMARMISGHHYFSDVLFGGFITYSAIVIAYYWLVDVPGQERIYRYQRTYVPFNQGYKLILEGKAAIKENKAEGVKSISAGLEKLAVAKANAEDINKYHHNLGPFIARIDDLTGRIGTLLQQQPINPKNWSYLC